MSSSIITGVSPVTEDFTRVGGFIAGCGEAALLVILHGAKGTPTDPTTLGNIIRAAASKGWVGPTGVSTPNGLTQLANSYGVQLTSGDWRTMLHTYAAQRPIIVGIANASAFGGRDSNVEGHYVTVVGRDPSGNYIVSDPNASSKFGKFDTYTEAQFSAARPFWAAVPTNWTGSTSAGGDTSGLAQPLSFNPLDPKTWLDALGAQFKTLFTWLSDPLRILKLVGGAGVVVVAIWLTVASIMVAAAPGALTLAGAASGQPEVAAAGIALKGSTQQRAQFIGRARQKPPRRSAQPKTASRSPSGSPSKTNKTRPPKPPKATPVYYGGKQVGVEREGKVVLEEAK
jgi:hypothetical protein